MSQAYRDEMRRVYEDPESCASTLIAALVDRLGVECFSWDPQSIQLEIADMYGADTPQENLDKINAGLLALTTNQFYKSLESFTNICNSLSGCGADFHVYDPAEIDEMAWGVTEIGLLAPPEEDKLSAAFSEEIKYYVGQRAQEEGLMRLPRPLDSFGIMTDAAVNAEDQDIDPDLYAAYWSSQQDEISAIENWVRENLQKLFAQIESLPLLHGDDAAWRAFSGRGLRETRRSTLLGETGLSLPPISAAAGQRPSPILQP